MFDGINVVCWIKLKHPGNEQTLLNVFLTVHHELTIQ